MKPKRQYVSVLISLIEFQAPFDDNQKHDPALLSCNTTYPGCCMKQQRQYVSVLIALIEFLESVDEILSTAHNQKSDTACSQKTHTFDKYQRF